MLSSVSSGLCKTAIMLAVTFGTSATFVVSSVEPAYANNGNGKGDGNSNRNNDKSNRDNGNSNRGNSSSNRNDNGNGNSSSNSQRNNSSNSAQSSSRSGGGGAISREVQGLNAAHATPAAMANAAPGSMPGKLSAYRNARRSLVAAVEAQNVAYAEYQRLSTMTPQQAAASYPDGSHAAALAAATNTYVALHDVAERAQNQTHQTLLQISGGRSLSQAAVAELNAMLGF